MLYFKTNDNKNDFFIFFTNVVHCLLMLGNAFTNVNKWALL